MEIRERLAFVDGHSLPLVSDGAGRVTAWLFAGGLASASVARAMDDSGVPTVGWGDVSVTARAADAGIVRCALDKMDPALTAGCRRPASGVRRPACDVWRGRGDR